MHEEELTILKSSFDEKVKNEKTKATREIFTFQKETILDFEHFLKHGQVTTDFAVQVRGRVALQRL